jgi:pimeloyl-ACP methyl ester carboxylesterase
MLRKHFLLLIFYFFCSLVSFGQVSEVNGRADSTSTALRISEEKFVLINGIEQWVTITGDPSKPAILFLHGGPGSTMSPYSDQLYQAWEKDFLIVQWDQRGAGRTYGRTAPEELTPEFLQENPLTLDQMTDDGIALSEYLLEHLRKDKLILFGTSWGSALGVSIATKRPDLFYAYVGHSQIVNPASDEGLYDKVLQLATSAGDSASLEQLDEIGKPPYDRARTVGQLWRIVKKYERQNSEPAPETWFVPSPDYDNAEDDRNRSDGDDYSFVNFVGDKVLGVAAMRRGINFLETGLDFKIPVYLIQGQADILTPMESTRLYFDRLQAPKKEYIVLPNTAHGFNQKVIDAQYAIFKSIETEH